MFIIFLNEYGQRFRLIGAALTHTKEKIFWCEIWSFFLWLLNESSRHELRFSIHCSVHLYRANRLHHCFRIWPMPHLKNKTEASETRDTSEKGTAGYALDIHISPRADWYDESKLFTQTWESCKNMSEIIITIYLISERLGLVSTQSYSQDYTF